MKRLFAAFAALGLLLSGPVFADNYSGGGGGGGGPGTITIPQTVGGSAISGGVACFTSATVLNSSGLLVANNLIVGGGAGVCPSTVTTGLNVLTTLAATVNATGGIVSPSPTRAGDIIYWNGTAWVTLPGNNTGTAFLQETAAGVPSWAGGTSSVTFTTTCPTSSQTGSTIAFDNTLPPTAETGVFTVSCGVGYQATVTAPTVVTIPVTNGLVAFVKSLAASTQPLILTPASGTIDGLATESLFPGQMVTVWSNGTNVSTDLNTVSSSACMEVSGRWCPSIGSQGTTGSVTGGGGNVSCALYAVSPPGFVANTIGGYVTTTDTGATGFIWLGIYTDTAGFPGTKIDDIGGTAITAPGANNTIVSKALANGTDAIAPGKYWLCQATPSTTLVMTGVSSSASWLVGGTSLSAAVNGANSGIAGYQCTAGSTGCGPSWTTGATYSGPANFTGATWGSRNAGGVPNMALEVN